LYFLSLPLLLHAQPISSSLILLSTDKLTNRWVKLVVWVLSIRDVDLSSPHKLVCKPQVANLWLGCVEVRWPYLKC
jgi:hypothetical protein